MMSESNRYARAALLSILYQVLNTSSVTLGFAPIQTIIQNHAKTVLFAATASTETVTARKPFFVNFAPASAIEKDIDAMQKDIENSFPMVDQNQPVGTGKLAVVAGGTGYIGRACVRECVARGYTTIALVRDPTKASTDEALKGASLVQCDVTNEQQMQSILKEIAAGTHASAVQQPSNNNKPEPVDLMISCLASPSGIESEVYAIDYQASLNLLDSGRNASVNARHFVLLSAFCCRNPILKLQQAKLEFEAKLEEQSDMTYSIVRPTAFFKSVSGQYESIMDGNSYVLFGDGAVTECNPIAEEELATYMCDSALEEYKEERWGKILNIGGPDEALSNKMLGEMMFKAIGKPAKFVYVPTVIFDWSIDMIEFIAQTWPSQKWEDVLETAKIGKYYAVEDMLTTEEHEKYGSIGMMDHFEKIASEGQDPFTPVRATAVISKTLEALPAISVSIPIGFGLLSKPELIQNLMKSGPMADASMVVASIGDSGIIS